MNKPLSLDNPLLKKLVSVFNDIPFNKILDVKLETLSSTMVSMKFNMKQELVGNFLYGILHGGVISSVLDMAGGMVAMSSTIENHMHLPFEELASVLGKCSTIDLHVSYVNPGRGEYFIAKAYLTKSGNKISFTRMELFNEAALLIATANATYLVK